MHFGVREHAMGAVVNGLSLSKVRGFGSTFLIFSDYARPAIRLSAIMEIPAIHVFTHDSIGVGEDGPTHQPIEQLASLRAIPGLITIRPADANEVVEAWRVIMKLQHQPAILVLSRQADPDLRPAPLRRGERGGEGRLRSRRRSRGKAGRHSDRHRKRGRRSASAPRRISPPRASGVRVVSMPSWELFEQQDQAYRDSVLPPEVTARVSVEQAGTFGWERYVGLTGAMIGMQSFGASAPLKELQKKFGFTVEHVVEVARGQLSRKTETVGAR